MSGAARPSTLGRNGGGNNPKEKITPSTTGSNKCSWLHCQYVDPLHNNNGGAPNVHDNVHREARCTENQSPTKLPHA